MWCSKRWIYSNVRRRMPLRRASGAGRGGGSGAEADQDHLRADIQPFLFVSVTEHHGHFETCGSFDG